MEENNNPTPNVGKQPETYPPLRVPATVEELIEIGKLPNCVKDPQTFEGDPTQYIPWVHNVESILIYNNIVRHKPIYRTIIQAIRRRKCKGGADAHLPHTTYLATIGCQ